ncbi:MAG: PDZ domain-containing protein [Firmicutes bacterium HGW-Firmicutes-13]|nr:MAG: PDZ domain-containing protein [Firmicutes bacterium HGW-Firmicutes-13]
MLMEFIINLLELMSKTFLLTFANIFFWLVVILVSFQYRRMVNLEEKMFGVPKNNVLRQTLISIGFGILGGVLASFLLIMVGISLEQVGIIYLWPLAILLMLVNPRYMCFAYAGGIIGMVSTVMKVYSPYLPQTGLIEGLININVPGLMALIGILHLTESMLIALSGHIGVSPMFIKKDKGEIVGGFSLQKFWPLPIVGLITLMVPEAMELVQHGMEMPGWWPLLGVSQLTAVEGQKAVFMMLPIVAGLGYGDFSIATPPRKKSLRSARNLGWYSIMLLILVILSNYKSELVLLAALFAPLGHEYLIIKGNKDEFSRKPLYVSPAEGIKILDVLPGCPGSKAGLSSGDVILKINDCVLSSRSDLHQCIQSEERYFKLYVKKSSGAVVKYEVNMNSFPKKLGIILVPDPDTPSYVELKRANFIQMLKKKMNRRKD